jgi:hypothetical protein
MNDAKELMQQNHYLLIVVEVVKLFVAIIAIDKVDHKGKLQ